MPGENQIPSDAYLAMQNEATADPIEALKKTYDFFSLLISAYHALPEEKQGNVQLTLDKIDIDTETREITFQESEHEDNTTAAQHLKILMAFCAFLPEVSEFPASRELPFRPGYLPNEQIRKQLIFLSQNIVARNSLASVEVLQCYLAEYHETWARLLANKPLDNTEYKYPRLRYNPAFSNKQHSRSWGDLTLSEEENVTLETVRHLGKGTNSDARMFKAEKTASTSSITRENPSPRYVVLKNRWGKRFKPEISLKELVNNFRWMIRQYGREDKKSDIQLLLYDKVSAAYRVEYLQETAERVYFKLIEATHNSPYYSFYLDKHDDEIRANWPDCMKKLLNITTYRLITPSFSTETTCNRHLNDLIAKARYEKNPESIIRQLFSDFIACLVGFDAFHQEQKAAHGDAKLNNALFLLKAGKPAKTLLIDFARSTEQSGFEKKETYVEKMPDTLPIYPDTHFKSGSTNPQNQSQLKTALIAALHTYQLPEEMAETITIQPSWSDNTYCSPTIADDCFTLLANFYHYQAKSIYFPNEQDEKVYFFDLHLEALLYCAEHDPSFRHELFKNGIQDVINICVIFQERVLAHMAKRPSSVLTSNSNSPQPAFFAPAASPATVSGSSSINSLSSTDATQGSSAQYTSASTSCTEDTSVYAAATP